MTKEDALKIRDLKKGCTYRRLAAQWYPINDPRHGDWYEGRELCRKAFAVLYPEKSLLKIQYGEEGEAFDSENKSHFGDHYWFD